MKKIGSILFSTQFMAYVTALFAASIAIATFIENDFGSASARAMEFIVWGKGGYKGDPLVVFVTSVLAYLNNRRIQKQKAML